MAAELLDNIQLIATDLDGTLLLNEAKSVRSEAYPIIERVIERGVYFFAASGRQYASLRRLFAPVADHIGYVCENGGLAVWQGEIIASQTMDRSLAMEICNMAESIPGCSYIASGVEVAYAPADKPEFIQRMREVVGNDMVGVDKPSDIPEEVIKVAFQVDGERLEEVRLQFEECFGRDCRAVTSGTTWVDMIVRGINKGSALEAVSHVIDVPVSAMAAFGDAENDREMLELVGHPYLMDPCFDTMLDIAELPQTKRCTCVEDELQRLLGE